MHLKLRRLSLFLVLFFTTSLALAQSEEPRVPRWVIAGGGGQSGDDTYQVSGTFGSSLSGQLRGSGFTLTNGLWGASKESVNRVLAIYALALDNRPTSPGNLSSYYPPTIDAIIAATVNQPDKIAVILADRDQQGDTHILVIRDGQRVPISLNDLPNANVREYDMTNGQLLGEFIRWARDTYPADKTYFSYIGHGLPLGPETDVTKIFPQLDKSVQAANRNDPFPILPVFKFSHPDITDFQPLGLISPYQLAQALRIGTNGGNDPLTVLDLMHCFAASIEQLYEISNPGGAPFAEVMIGSPNYTYFAPELLNGALTAVNHQQTAAEMAGSILDVYERILADADKVNADPDFTHPRLMVAVESSKIPPIKQAMDRMSSALLANFDAGLIKKAYENESSGKYDTSYCAPQDWALGPPDGLSDLAGFTSNLADQYPSVPAVRDAALSVAAQARAAILAKKSQGGKPWFAERAPKPEWTFADSLSGISLYTDFQGAEDNGITRLSWHAHWYTPENAAGDNPHPYAFIQGNQTWATVFQRFWQADIDANKIVAQPCIPEFPEIVRKGELTVNSMLLPRKTRGMLSDGSPIRLTAEVQTSMLAPKALVNFIVQDVNQKIVFTDTVSAGYLITGTHKVEASRLFTPTESEGGYTISVRVDPNNAYDEDNESNNTLIERDHEVVPKPTFKRPTVTGKLVDPRITGNEMIINVTKDTGTSELNRLEVTLYQYQQGRTPKQQIPKLVNSKPYTRTVLLTNEQNATSIRIPTTLLVTGTVEIHIWGINGANFSTTPSIIKANYIPTLSSVRQGETQYFLIDAELGDRIQITADLPDDGSQNVSLFVWDPNNYSEPSPRSTAPGDAKVNVNATFPGEYVVGLYGVTNARYTLNIVHQNSQENNLRNTQFTEDEEFLQEDEGVYIPKQKPDFLKPIPTAPGTEPGVTLHLPLIRREETIVIQQETVNISEAELDKHIYLPQVNNNLSSADMK